MAMFRLVALTLIAAIAAILPVDGFSSVKMLHDVSQQRVQFADEHSRGRGYRYTRARIQSVLAVVTQMESDFGSAMPEKPTVTPDEHMRTCADNFILSMRGSLAEGTDELPEVQVLADALENGAGAHELAIRVYELMIERGMNYEVCPDTGTMTATHVDVPSNLDAPEVRQEFLHLYTYGMNLIQNGLISVDDTKSIVEQRLIPRTGLTPTEFDEWLGF
jgi:hypothetical protein